MDKNLKPDNTDKYVDYINANILPNIDYDKLHESYQTKDKEYAKGLLNALHKGAISCYGTEYFDGHDGNEYVLLPAVVRSKEKGNICISLLEIDLLSSGEHCGTDFLTKYGVLPQFDETRPERITKFLFDTYGNYDYAYTIPMEVDHHVDFENLHGDIKEILETFQEFEIQFKEEKLPKCMLRGYIYSGDGRKDYWFESSEENIAKFIMLNQSANEIIITDGLDNFVLNTIGYFIDKCADKETLEKLLPIIMPYQEGEKEVSEMTVYDGDSNKVILSNDSEIER